MRTFNLVIVAIVALLIVIGTAYYALGVMGNNPVSNNSTGTGYGEPQGWGLSGFVYDQNKVPVPGATVTIYKSTPDNVTGVWTNGEILEINVTSMPNSGNPQLTNNGSTAAAGTYMFSDVSGGTYNVTAEKDGHMWYADVFWGGDSTSVNIALPGYTYVPNASTPAPGSLSPAPVAGPWATLAGTVTDDNGTPVTNATVTLWAVVPDKNGEEVNLGMADPGSEPLGNSTGPTNPVLSSDGSHAAPGTYAFYKVPWGLYNVTAEKNGTSWSAMIVLGQGGDFGTGICNVGGTVWSGNSIEGFGTISGIVTDQNKIGIPGANVTLWNAGWNNTSGMWDNMNLAKIKDNPQISNNGSTGAIGMYTFYMVPWGVYNVTADINGSSWYSLLLLGPGDAYKNASYMPAPEFGTATYNIAIPDYTYIMNSSE
jgi:protocatechuate 3,4-dioxygenase beta subunit